MATTRQEPETDTLDHLEERIQRAVALVNRLRGERENALKELAETQAALAESKSSNEHLSGEVESLRSERQHVRSRIEKLLGHIDQLGTA